MIIHDEWDWMKWFLLCLYTSRAGTSITWVLLFPFLPFLAYCRFMSIIVQPLCPECGTHFLVVETSVSDRKLLVPYCHPVE